MVARTQPLALPLPRRREFHVVIGPRAVRRRIGGWIALAITVAASSSC